MINQATLESHQESSPRRRAARLCTAVFVPALLAIAGCGPEPEDSGNTQDPVGTTTPGTTVPDMTPAPTTTNGSPMPSTPGTTPDMAGAPVAAAPDACLNTGTPDADGNLLLLAQSEHNYRFSSELELSLTSVAPNSDLSFDWSALTADFLGHQVDPLADIDTVAVILWALTPEEVKAKLNADELGASSSKGAVAIYTENLVTSGSTHAAPTTSPEEQPKSEDFSVVGGGELPHAELLARFDPTQWDPALHSYTVMAMEGGQLGQGVKMVHAFQLDPNSTNTEIVVTPQSTVLSYETSLTELMPVKMPVGVNNVLVDWSQMEMNALGRPFLQRSVDQVLVAKYTQTPAELEQEFLDLELIAQETYRGEVAAGEEMALTGLANDAGQPFTGITADGTWILALMCGRCGNPAPWYLTVLTPCQ